MRIGIDIDDTITTTTKDMDRYAKNYIKDTKIDESKYYIKERYGWDKDICEKFWYTYAEEIMNCTSLRDKASDYINKLHDDGNIIYFITARDNKYSDNILSVTEDYLEKHGIEYDYLITGANNKNMVCLDNDIDIMIDDCPYHAPEFKDSKVSFMLMDNDYNKDVDCLRVNSWEEIYNLITRR